LCCKFEKLEISKTKEHITTVKLKLTHAYSGCAELVNNILDKPDKDDPVGPVAQCEEFNEKFGVKTELTFSINDTNVCFESVKMQAAYKKQKSIKWERFS